MHRAEVTLVDSMQNKHFTRHVQSILREWTENKLTRPTTSISASATSSRVAWNASTSCTRKSQEVNNKLQNGQSTGEGENRTYPFSFLIEKRLTEAESCRKYKDKEIKANCCWKLGPKDKLRQGSCMKLLEVSVIMSCGKYYRRRRLSPEVACD
jgi:hypothetical protein